MSIFQQGLWSCGFDFLPSSAITAGGVFDIGSTGGGGCTVSSAVARFSTGKGVTCVTPTTYFGRSFNVNQGSFYDAFAFQTTALPGSGVSCAATFYDSSSGAPQFSLGYDSTGALGFYSVGGFPSATNLSSLIGSATAAGVIVPNAYNFIEVFGLINSVSGSLICRINNSVMLSFSGNTRTTANSFVNRIYWGLNGPSGPVHNFDDFYILDGTGSAPLNTFLGNGRLQTDGPTGDSSTGGLNVWAFTSPQGSDYANCANIPANAAQYNSSATVGARMSLSFPTLSVAQCLFLNTWFSVEEDSAGTRGVTPIYRSSNADQTGAPISLPGSFTYYNQVSTVDPATSTMWASEAPSVAGACEIGLEVSS